MEIFIIILLALLILAVITLVILSIHCMSQNHEARELRTLLCKGLFDEGNENSLLSLLLAQTKTTNSIHEKLRILLEMVKGIVYLTKDNDAVIARLISAMGENNLETLEWLREIGLWVRPDIRTDDGSTLGHIAIEKLEVKAIPMLEFLKGIGLTFEEKDDSGKTAKWFWKKLLFDPEVIKSLDYLHILKKSWELGLWDNPNINDDNENTLAHCVVDVFKAKGDVSKAATILEFLKEKKADFTIKNKAGKTAAELLEKDPEAKIVLILLTEEAQESVAEHTEKAEATEKIVTEAAGPEAA